MAAHARGRLGWLRPACFPDLFTLLYGDPRVHKKGGGALLLLQRDHVTQKKEEGLIYIIIAIKWLRV